MPSTRKNTLARELEALAEALEEAIQNMLAHQDAPLKDRSKLLFIALNALFISRQIAALMKERLK
ncbi:MAG: hypothetical protein ACOZAP_09870 [Pseudomonadota bacterium]|jgi:hypothetical protein